TIRKRTLLAIAPRSFPLRTTFRRTVFRCTAFALTICPTAAAFVRTRCGVAAIALLTIAAIGLLTIPPVAAFSLTPLAETALRATAVRTGALLPAARLPAARLAAASAARTVRTGTRRALRLQARDGLHVDHLVGVALDRADFMAFAMQRQRE